jgi:hypothetical protein
MVMIHVATVATLCQFRDCRSKINQSATYKATTTNASGWDVETPIKVNQDRIQCIMEKRTGRRHSSSIFALDSLYWNTTSAIEMEPFLLWEHVILGRVALGHIPAFDPLE